MGQIGIRIDRDECILCGACWEACPQVFEENVGDGLSQVVAAYQVNEDPARGQVSEELEDCVQAAADDCPVGIIHVEPS